MSSFLTKWFCNHDFVEMEVLVYKGRNKLPRYEETFLKCSKCGKVVENK